MTAPKLTVKSMVLCDEIRREASGKFTILGAYQENIIIPTESALLRLALYASVASPGAGRHELWIHFASDKERMSSIRAVVDPKGEVSVLITTPPMPITVTVGKKLNVLMHWDEGRAVTVLTRGVQRGEVQGLISLADTPPPD